MADLFDYIALIAQLEELGLADRPFTVGELELEAGVAAERRGARKLRAMRARGLVASGTRDRYLLMPAARQALAEYLDAVARRSHG